MRVKEAALALQLQTNIKTLEPKPRRNTSIIGDGVVVGAAVVIVVVVLLVGAVVVVAAVAIAAALAAEVAAAGSKCL